MNLYKNSEVLIYQILILSNWKGSFYVYLESNHMLKWHEMLFIVMRVDFNKRNLGCIYDEKHFIIQEMNI